MLFKFSLLSALVSVAVGLPTSSIPQGNDPALQNSQATLDAALVCPNQPGGSYVGVTKPILLLPGTGTSGSVSWDHTYVPLLSQLGYQPCHVSPPDNMLDDLQDGAEYAVNGVRRLYSQTRKPVPVMTWSAGGLIAQWTLTFFPQTREKVDRVVAFAPDYRGTIEAYLLTALQYISPDIWQQQTFSHFVTTLANAGGFQTIKPTTTMYSINDEIVEPETPDAIASGYLPGASNNRIQDVCGPLFLVEHSQELFNQATYTIATAALASKTGQAPAGSLTVANCSELPPAGLTPADVAFDITIIPQAGANILLGPKVTCEPPIRSYAAKYDTLPNTCFNNLTQSQQYANAKGFTAPFSSQQQVADYIAGNSTLTAAIKKSIGYSS